ncbi:dolichyl-phosphate beta-glucosyltransferase [Coemansia sp. RSA 1250]|nr:dolichyl-phosphate beta-glucosyltransferase [Coemansia sp. RSA 1086]KAJ2652701.1 dolichyl-phosphate beta-glucosyltransferase [Coemansia sp. RSA 1250]
MLELLVSAFAGIAALVVVCSGLVIRFKSPQPRMREESENFYLGIDDRRQRLGDLNDDASVDLSIVVPAYNEEARLPVLLEDIRKYINSRRQQEPHFKYELLVMDDGSKDKTLTVAIEYAKKHKIRELKAVRHIRNRGKGGAVTQGVMCSLGRYILFCDADGATQFSDIDKLLSKAEHGAIAIGSRSNQALTGTVVERSHIRAFLQWGFHTYVTMLGVHGIRDTQCGFKLFSREAARRVFPNMHVERFIFDVEILLLAKYQNIPVVEVPVNWHEVAGSKMSIVRDSIQMALDLLAVRLNYLLGNWKIKD